MLDDNLNTVDDYTLYKSFLTVINEDQINEDILT